MFEIITHRCTDPTSSLPVGANSKIMYTKYGTGQLANCKPAHFLPIIKGY